MTPRVRFKGLPGIIVASMQVQLGVPQIRFGAVLYGVWTPRNKSTHCRDACVALSKYILT